MKVWTQLSKKEFVLLKLIFIAHYIACGIPFTQSNTFTRHMFKPDIWSVWLYLARLYTSPNIFGNISQVSNFPIINIFSIHKPLPKNGLCNGFQRGVGLTVEFDFLIQRRENVRNAALGFN